MFSWCYSDQKVFAQGWFREGSAGSVECLFTQNFIFKDISGRICGILLLPSIFTPLTLNLILLFNKSIQLPVNVCKIAWWVANCANPDQTPRSAASHLGLRCLLRPVFPNISGKYDNLIKSNPSEIILDPSLFANLFKGATLKIFSFPWSQLFS